MSVLPERLAREKVGRKPTLRSLCVGVVWFLIFCLPLFMAGFAGADDGKLRVTFKADQVNITTHGITLNPSEFRDRDKIEVDLEVHQLAASPQLLPDCGSGSTVVSKEFGPRSQYFMWSCRTACSIDRFGIIACTMRFQNSQKGGDDYRFHLYTSLPNGKKVFYSETGKTPLGSGLRGIARESAEEARADVRVGKLKCDYKSLHPGVLVLRPEGIPLVPQDFESTETIPAVFEIEQFQGGHDIFPGCKGTLEEESGRFRKSCDISCSLKTPPQLECSVSLQRPEKGRVGFWSRLDVLLVGGRTVSFETGPGETADELPSPEVHLYTEGLEFTTRSVQFNSENLENPSQVPVFLEVFKNHSEPLLFPGCEDTTEPFFGDEYELAGSCGILCAVKEGNLKCSVPVQLPPKRAEPFKLVMRVPLRNAVANAPFSYTGTLNPKATRNTERDGEFEVETAGDELRLFTSTKFKSEDFSSLTEISGILEIEHDKMDSDAFPSCRREDSEKRGRFTRTCKTKCLVRPDNSLECDLRIQKLEEVKEDALYMQLQVPFRDGNYAFFPSDGFTSVTIDGNSEERIVGIIDLVLVVPRYSLTMLKASPLVGIFGFFTVFYGLWLVWIYRRSALDGLEMNQVNWSESEPGMGCVVPVVAVLRRPTRGLMCHWIDRSGGGDVRTLRLEVPGRRPESISANKAVEISRTVFLPLPARRRQVILNYRFFLGERNCEVEVERREIRLRIWEQGGDVDEEWDLSLEFLKREDKTEEGEDKGEEGEDKGEEGEDKGEEGEDKGEEGEDKGEEGEDKGEEGEDKGEEGEDKTEEGEDKTEELEDKTEELEDKTEELEDKTEELEDKTGGVVSVGSMLSPGQLSPDAGRRLIILAAHKWWHSGMTRQEFLDYLEIEASFRDVQLYRTRRTGKALEGVGSRKFFFEPDRQNGAWLWVDLTVEGEALVVPGDRGFISGGDQIQVVASLFGGISAVPKEIYFETVHRPCRLCRTPGVSNVFEVVEAGSIGLRGGPVTATAMVDAVFINERPSVRAGLTKNLERKKEIQKEASITGVSSEGRTHSEIPRDQIANLSSQLSDSHDLLQELAKDVSAIDLDGGEGRGRNIVSEIAGTKVDPTENVYTRLDELSRKLETLTDRVEEVAGGFINVQYKKEEGVKGHSISESDEQPELPRRDGARARDEVLSPSANTFDDAPKFERRHASGPIEWHQGILLELPESLQRTMSIHRGNHKEEYIRRLVALKEFLGREYTQWKVEIVHLHPAKELQVHGAKEDLEGGMICDVCRGRAADKQFFVTMSSDSSTTIAVLMPLGEIKRYWFNMGYDILIRNPPRNSAIIDSVKEAALLAPISGMEHKVIRLMVLEYKDDGKEIRSRG